MVKETERHLISDAGVEEKPSVSEVMPIWEKISALGKSIPEAGLDDVPTDVSKNYKHYLFGTPFRYT
jgi:hypothetical protein